MTNIGSSLIVMTNAISNMSTYLLYRSLASIGSQMTVPFLHYALTKYFVWKRTTIAGRVMYKDCNLELLLKIVLVSCLTQMPAPVQDRQIL